MTAQKRQALLVLGMHRSGTSALAGLLGEMGCDLPVDIMAPADMNAKGFFESNKISYFNEDLLATAGMTWFDLKRFPEDWYQTAHAAEFRQRAAGILREEYGQSGLFVIKDPRICRLMPFWCSVLEAEGCAPTIVYTLRNPLEVAESLTRWANYEPLYGQILWLRHVLDSEAESRGMNRVFVSYDLVLADWQGTVTRIADGLGITWPKPPELVAKAAKDLLTTDLRHYQAARNPGDEIDVQSDWVREAFRILERWSVSGEDKADFAALDALRAKLDDAESTYAPITTQLLDRYHEARLLRDEVVAYSTSLKSAEARLATANAKRNETVMNDKAAQNEIDALNYELAAARRRPMRNLGKYVHFKVLKALSSRYSPLPSKLTVRMARSAQKRDPKRSLLALSTPEGVRPELASRSVSFGGEVTVDAAKPHILIVSHEASRTGAPILALNLVQSLSERYNVTTLCLYGGELIDSFRAHSVTVWVSDQRYGNTAYFSGLLEDIARKEKFAFAVVNSIVARHVLGALRTKGIPSVALLHEFASYTLPETAFDDVFRNADQIVFSTDLTLSNALENTGQPRTSRIHVAAQGKCLVPVPNVSAAQHEAERNRLTSILRPAGTDADRFLVIGAGYVQYRKGVDLFIDAARRVLAHPDGKRAFFAWIGAGYSPEKDAGYSVYLRDQLDRAGLTDRVIMIPDTSEIEHVYSLSNALLLTSRLDPLPNVAIDAMSEGLPVLCFDKASGIVELLEEAGLSKTCVAAYLDTADIADKVLGLMRSPETCAQIGAETKAYAAEMFGFARYADRIEQIALSGRMAPDSHASDIATQGREVAR